MLSDPQRGDIIAQRAMIIEKITPKVGTRASLRLHISDEYGSISEPKIPGHNIILMFEDNFNAQFMPDPALPDTFIGRFKIHEYDREEGIIYYYRIDSLGKATSVLCKEPKEKFLDTHFLDQEDFGKKTAPEEEEIIDLEEEMY